MKWISTACKYKQAIKIIGNCVQLYNAKLGHFKKGKNISVVKNSFAYLADVGKTLKTILILTSVCTWACSLQFVYSHLYGLNKHFIQDLDVSMQRDVPLSQAIGIAWCSAIQQLAIG